MRVRGTILSDIGDYPVKGASLYSEGVFGKKLLGVTNCNGEFNISANDARAFQVTISKVGFKPYRIDPADLDERFTLLQSSDTTKVADTAKIIFAGVGAYLLLKLLIL